MEPKKARRVDGAQSCVSTTPLDVALDYNSPVLDPDVSEKCPGPHVTLDDLPNELLDEISGHMLTPDDCIAQNKSLCALSLTSKRFTTPAQSALVRKLVIEDPAKVDDLTKLFLKRKHLSKSVRQLDITIPESDTPGDPSSSSPTRRALELNLLGMLPLTKTVRDVSVSAKYDCPASLVDLLTRTLVNVRSFSLSSAFGYSKLVYVGIGSLARILSSWMHLEHLSMTMPWVLEDGYRRRNNIRSSLKSCEISGFRGEMADLEWLLGCISSSLSRFAFDCPLDNEQWHQLAPILAKHSATLTDLSLWSWTYAMPVEEILRTCQRIKHISVAAHDCTPKLFRLLPSRLSSLLVCSHRDFSPLRATEIAAGLASKHALRRLPRLTLYDPSANGVRFNEVSGHPAWLRARQRGTTIVVTSNPCILGAHINLATVKDARNT